jgi:hypothetical protein
MDPLVPALQGNGYRYDMRVIEDAEDGDASNWDLWDADPYGEAVCVTDPDDASNLAIQFQSVPSTAHRVYLAPYDTKKHIVQWRMRYSGTFYFMVYCRTTAGYLNIRYPAGTTISSVDDIDPSVGIGNGLATGTWVTVRRNLLADLRTLYADADILEVKAFIARGGGYVDDICLLAYPDADLDLIPDSVEAAYGLDPADPADAGTDPDGDGLTSIEEFYLGTNPLAADSDDDGLSDSLENSLGTDPLAIDTDGDGLADGKEVSCGMDPLVPALEGNGYLYDELVVEDAEDGTTNGWTIPYADPPCRVLNTLDTEDEANRVISFETDGASGDALFRFSLPSVETARFKLSWRGNFTANYVVYVSCQTSVGHRYLAYHSGDWAVSGGEYIRHALGVGAGIGEWATFHRDFVADLRAVEPEIQLDSVDSIYIRGVGSLDRIAFLAYPDADRDLLPDSVETAYGLDPADPSDATGDADGDGIASLDEFYLGTSPVSSDTDGDGLADGDELLYVGTDPLNPDEDGDGILDGADTALPGLAVAYFDGQFTAIPNFDLVAHYRSDRAPNISWSDSSDECVDSGLSAGVAALFAGAIHVPADGTYEFRLTANDGARILIDGVEAITLQYEGYLGWSAAPLVQTFTVELAAGAHEFRAEYFQYRGNHAFVLDWRLDGGDFVPVPTEVFSFDPSWLLGMATTIDSDGDGLGDAAERAGGTDPYKVDTDGDGLSDTDELNVHGTDPLVADTDGDGVNDYMEINDAKTNPLVAEFDGTETVLSTVLGSSFTGVVGTWQVDGTAIVSRDRQGTVGGSFVLDAAGVCVIEVAGTQDNSLSALGTFVVDGYVDGCYLGRMTIEGPIDTVGTGRLYLPWLAAGTHSLTLQWRNTDSNTFLRLLSVSVLELGGPDSDGDGILDWIEARDLLTQADVPEASTSRVSPFFIEGTATHADLVDLRSSFVPDDTLLATDGQDFLVNHILQGVGQGWYANLPLSPEGETQATLTLGNGLSTQPFSVLWEPTDVLAGGEITVRVGDSLLLGAHVGNGNANGQWNNGGNINPNDNGPVTIEVEDSSFQTTPGGTVPYQFLNHGTIAVNATFAPGNGKAQEGQLLVHVVGGTLSASPVALVGSQRQWDNPHLYDEAVLEYDSHLSLVELPATGTSRSFSMLLGEDRPARVVARVGEDGPIVSSTTVEPVTYGTAADTGFVVLQRYSDGSQLIEGRITLSNVPADLELHFHIFAGGVTFDDGTIDKVFTADDFSDTGELRFRFLRAEDGYTAACHYIQFYQNGVLIGNES